MLYSFCFFFVNFRIKLTSFFNEVFFFILKDCFIALTVELGNYLCCYHYCVLKSFSKFRKAISNSVCNLFLYGRLGGFVRIQNLRKNFSGNCVWEVELCLGEGTEIYERGGYLKVKNLCPSTNSTLICR